jgi:phosphoenolpyruvate synthase/pyruvate phosphate dikinase
LVEVDANKGIVRILPKNSQEKMILVKEHSREYSLLQVVGYCDIIDRVNKETGQRLDNELFLYNRLVDVYHSPQEIKKFFMSVGECAKDKKFADRVLKDFQQALEDIKPYLEEKKFVKNVAELKVLHEIFIRFWLGIAYVWVIPGLENVPKETRDRAMNLREQTERYSSKRDKVMVINLKKLYPELGENVKFLLPQEAFNIKSNPNLKKDLDERSKGYIFYNGQLYSGESIKTFAGDKNIELMELPSTITSDVKGTTAYKGVVKGKVCLVITKSDLKKVISGDILVSPMTRPEFLPAMNKAAAFVTDEGGITCHAAIVSREMKKPCIIGTKNATKVLKDGDYVEVDANSGIVRILK